MAIGHASPELEVHEQATVLKAEVAVEGRRVVVFHSQYSAVERFENGFVGVDEVRGSGATDAASNLC